MKYLRYKWYDFLRVIDRVIHNTCQKIIEMLENWNIGDDEYWDKVEFEWFLEKSDPMPEESIDRVSLLTSEIPEYTEKTKGD